MKKVASVLLFVLLPLVGQAVPYFFRTGGGGAQTQVGWQYRKSITIDHTKVAGTLTNFVVLGSFTLAPSKVQSDGDDIVFTDSDGTTIIPHEIERYNDITGQLICWFKVPQLSSYTDKVVYINYGNPSSENQQQITATWDANYKGVWHLDETSGIVYDSTSNANNGTPYNGVNQNIEGKIDGADSFDGGNDYISVPNSASLNLATDFTLEAWVRPNGYVTYNQIIDKRTGGTADPVNYHFRLTPVTGRLVLAIYDGLNLSQIISNNLVAIGVWSHVIAIRDTVEDKLKLYINGVEAATPVTDTTISFITNNANVFIGARSPDAANPFNGSIDEVHISNVARSADWITTSYNNQNSPDAFYSVGSEEDSPL